MFPVNGNPHGLTAGIRIEIRLKLGTFQIGIVFDALFKECEPIGLRNTFHQPCLIADLLLNSMLTYLCKAGRSGKITTDIIFSLICHVRREIF